MIKLNSHQYPVVEDICVSKEFAIDILKNNDQYNAKEKAILKLFQFNFLKTFSFSKDGFFSLLCELSLKGNVAISVGETHAVYEAGKLCESLEFDITWIPLKEDGHLDIKDIQNLDLDYIFISSYTMDTYVKNDLEMIKKLTNAAIISNATNDISQWSDAIYFDPYKLSGFNFSGILLSNGIFYEQELGFRDGLSVVLHQKLLEEKVAQNTINGSTKASFQKVLIDIFKDDIYFFVDSKDTLPNTLHFGLKKLKARELIRTLALDGIFITNGEGCSLGLSQPSRIVQMMDYKEDHSRNAISLCFDSAKNQDQLTQEKMKQIVELMFKRYQQIRTLND